MIRGLFFISLLIQVTLAQKPAAAPSPKKWLTLNGNEPLVIARGGLSGLFPESSEYATKMAMDTSVSNVVMLCSLQLTKDGIGICQSNIKLDNSTNIALVFPKASKTYNVNGQQVHGWFAVDYTSQQLSDNVTLVQNVFSRPSSFDGLLPISGVEDVVGAKPPQVWLNVQYEKFYTEHKLSVVDYVVKAMNTMSYISSPEIGFLKTMSGKVNKVKTKLIFVFLEPDAVEPTTNKKYSAILNDLASIKSFATGILVPKEYIWPVDANKYLEPATTLVADAHKQSLEVYASGFANDYFASYNYSYDPTAEYLQFIDNSQFAVDGVVTDFPPTASEAIACLAMNNGSKPTKGNALIITHNGASGIYPPCTDLAYQQAVDDGADIIDCSVQMSKDGVAFCLDSPDLMGGTTAMTSFISRATSIPEIQQNNGIFSFDLTWSEIQTLKPEMISPFGTNAGMQRNPANKNAGKLMTLAEFLEFAKTKAVSGILINIEYAAYLASNKGLSVVDAVTAALSNATLDQQSTQQVLIQSDDSSVLSKFANVPTYKRVLHLKEEISDAPKQPVDELKKYANAVTVPRPSIITIDGGFATSKTNIVKELHAANISVYASVMRNEFVAIAYDLFSDPMVELATYIAGMEVDGVVTEYPGTASKYMRSPCSNLDANLPYFILPAEPGQLLNLVPAEVMPPAAAPSPALDVADVVDPPLPALANKSDTTNPADVAPPPRSSGMVFVANVGMSLLTIMVLSLLSLGY
ncbi:GDPD domain-containing protein [Cephalotus follicularis]|uniref:glycerophosphodiester phosphodiesterase n=1 Tax=Cephalotus follicularis TaxID=3775 RepID=A0A1Q3CI88_CEPFO|nr:GDPD domain-containing protein [Cephalotus follicularis]